MSSAKRAYDLMRGYVNREWDRVRGLERLEAESELRGETSLARETFAQNHRGPIEAAYGTDEQHAARLILGVAEGADFREVRKSYERLDRRSDPEKFPAGSDEQKRAAELRERIRWAYRKLTADVSEQEKRFGSLEID